MPRAPPPKNPLVMARLVLVDSNFYIARAKVGADPFPELAAHASRWEIATCGMVALEVCRGRRVASVRRRFIQGLSLMVYLQATSRVWERATGLAWELECRGVILPSPDLLIAALALEANAAVLTADRHFSAVPGLSVVADLD